MLIARHPVFHLYLVQSVIRSFWTDSTSITMPKITIETSDGDKGNWPAGWLDHAVPISSNENYHEKVKP
jgi:hypothetical protein